MTNTTAPGWAPAPRQGLVPLYPYGFGTIMGRSFAALRGNPKVLLLFVVGVQTLAMTLYLAALLGISAAAFSRADTVDPASAEFQDLMWGAAAITLIGGIVLTFALAAVTTIAQGVVIAEVSHAALAEKAPFSRLWKRVRPAFWRLFGYSLLIGLATIIALAVLAVPLVLLGLANTPVTWVFFVVLLLLELLGGIVVYAWLGTKLFFVPSAIVLERVRPFRAIARSWTLTRGRFWPTFGVAALLYLVTNIAASVISSALSLFAPLITSTLVPFGVGESTSVAATVLGFVFLGLSSILSFAIASIMTIITGAGGVLTYIDARMREEGIDLRMRRYVEAHGDADDPYEFLEGAQPSPHASPVAPPTAYPAYGAPPQYAPPQYGAYATQPPAPGAPTVPASSSDGHAPSSDGPVPSSDGAVPPRPADPGSRPQPPAPPV
ncbi:hypothetical protein GCM10010910_14330 [Microbacterium nanhaiense]|uniref:Glycerophosphoryl diester phosphodiesterase membrane domain-containing protein n=1 Tax=Microbacterium nanhaiense TaxID=1301026 RepID=A0ABQ2N1A2_9MICO|nr:hypothetical protein [Microbacterium nanhaiense]GGO62954.1 hypothetical protein GCM10010910_14330 [Microbacterium nanhaiense]